MELAGVRREKPWSAPQSHSGGPRLRNRGATLRCGFVCYPTPARHGPRPRADFAGLIGFAGQRPDSIRLIQRNGGRPIGCQYRLDKPAETPLRIEPL